MNMNDYVTSNFIKADDLEDKVILEFRIADVSEKEFLQKDGEIQKKAVIRLDDGRGIVLNQTRLRVLIAAFGPNPENWINRPIRVTKGETMYQGKKTASVDVEPIHAERIEPPKKAKMEITSGRKKSASAAKPDFYDDEIEGGAFGEYPDREEAPF